MDKRSFGRQLVTDDARWKAVSSRQAEADGVFVYCVKTTGVYCKPSCRSKLPKRENVVFAATAEDAVAGGYRPCKRCGGSPSEKHDRSTEIVSKVCRIIQASEDRVDIDNIIKTMGVSRSHFHRLFRSLTGTTPKAYEGAVRAKRLATSLSEHGTVTEAIYASGFGSNGRFYSESGRILGMTPTQYRNAGAEAVIRFALGKTSLGSILVGATDKGICTITLGDDPELLVRELQDTFPEAELVGGDSNFEDMVSKVVGYVESPEKNLNLPLDIRGTVFQTRVWEALRRIPSGTTATYSEVAALIGQPRSVRAVANACANNKLALAIPCHRVVRTDGSLSGYRWGVERKRELLDRERAISLQKEGAPTSILLE